jgi:adenosylcobinamide kinase/adenosylcobinamide-phosphate guanylyltransferase
LSGPLVLVGGGVRSGKSAFALDLARRMGSSRAFVATAQALDAEMAARIERHRRERAEDFETIEEPLDLTGALARARGREVVVVDCLTLWMSNLILRGDSPEQVEEQVRALAQAASRASHATILVTNEVGMGVVPESALGRSFRDAAGRAHQRLARDAARVYFAALGTMLRLKPGPIALVQDGDAP